jgi:hypothetical protein
MFGVTSAYRFFEKVRGDHGRVEADISDPGAALNCILSLYHLHEWVWARWLKRRSDVQATLGIRKGKGTACGSRRNKGTFIAWLDANCPHFTLLQELANGTKHCSPVHPTEHVAGYGRGPWGVGPFDAPYLLIDLGEEYPAGERYLVASAVLKSIMDFWSEFFADLPPGTGHSA